MSTRRRVAIVVFAIAIMLAMLACQSTLCQDSQNLNDWLGGIATRQPCW